MLRSTIRQMASISGRAIIAISLTSATVLALAPSAKADDVVVNNPASRSISYSIGTAGAPVAGLITATKVGTLTANANAVFVVKANSDATGAVGNLGSGATSVPYTLKIGTGSGSPATAAPTGTAAVFYTGTATEAAAAIGEDLDVVIDTGATDWRTLPVGTYSDTLVVTIAGS